MPQRRVVRAFAILWWTAGALLFYWSVQTAHEAFSSGDPPRMHLALLGGVEALSAFLFLIPRTIRIGAGGLLVTFAIAFVAHAHQLEFRGDLLFFGAVVWFVAVHGPIPIASQGSHS